MVAFTAETPRKEITVSERTFSLPLPYTAGHPLTEGEASHMNQLLAENIRNNVAGKLKVAEGEAAATFSQEDFDQYVQAYEFGQRRQGTTEAKLTPVERETRRIAKEKLEAAVKAKGLTLDRKSDEGKAKYEELLSALCQRPAIISEAQKRIRALDKISVEELGIDLGEATEEVQAAA